VRGNNSFSFTGGNYFQITVAFNALSIFVGKIIVKRFIFFMAN